MSRRNQRCASDHIRREMDAIWANVRFWRAPDDAAIKAQPAEGTRRTLKSKNVRGFVRWTAVEDANPRKNPRAAPFDAVHQSPRTGPELVNLCGRIRQNPPKLTSGR